MLQRTTPSGPIVVDATAQDTGHRTRGIGRYARSLWRAMSALDDEVVALRLTEAGRSWQASMSERHLLRFIEAQRHLGQELDRAGCTVFGATEPWVLPRETRRLRVVPTCHDLIPLEFSSDYGGWDHAKWAVYWRWLRSTRALHRCSHVIAPSEATRASLVHFLDVDPEHVSVIPHGIDHDRFFPPSDEDISRVRTELGIGAEPYLLYVGGYDFRKNVRRLVEGFAASRRDSELLLVLAGPASHAEQSEIFDIARDAGVDRRVVWTGRVGEDQLNGLYGGAEAFMYPSLSEGFGLQLLEAMACGCPVVTSDRSALAEVANGAAVLVDPLDGDAIGAAIEQLTPSTLKELRGLGLSHARKFDWSKTAQATLDLYRKVS